jgi:hypothetical protein
MSGDAITPSGVHETLAVAGVKSTQIEPRSQKVPSSVVHVLNAPVRIWAEARGNQRDSRTGRDRALECKEQAHIASDSIAQDLKAS